jgi:hypothetical protein
MRASIDPVVLISTMLYAKAMSTGGGRVKRENTKKSLGRIGSSAVAIAARMQTAYGNEGGTAGRTTM